MKRSLVLIVLALVLWSCGGSDDNEDGAADSDTNGTESASELQKKLLTTSDLPSGYTVSETDSTDTASEFCDGKFDLTSAYPPEQDAEIEFEKTGTEPLSGNLIGEVLTEYSTEGAQEAFTGVQSAVQECATFQQTDEEDGTVINGQIEPIASFPELGDETFAIKVAAQITIQDTTVPLALEVVFVRQEGTIIGVANGGLGASTIDSQLTEELTEVAYQKAF
jgi:hypothetical protein